MDVSESPVSADLEPSWRQMSSMMYGQSMSDAVKPPSGKHSPDTGTVIALLARSTTAVNDERPHPGLDLDGLQLRGTRSSSKALQPDRLSTHVSNKFTDNFQHGIIPTFVPDFVSDFTK